MKAYTFKQQQYEISAATNRERRRIRRAQAKTVAHLRKLWTPDTDGEWLATLINDLDCSTRPPKGQP